MQQEYNFTSLSESIPITKQVISLKIETTNC